VKVWNGNIIRPKSFFIRGCIRH